MVKQSSSQEESKSSEYFRDVKAAQSEVKPTSQAVSGPRADLLPGSQVTPATKTGLQKINRRLVADSLMMLAILGLFWYVMAGPGHSKLEQMLASLRPPAPTDMQQVIPSTLPATGIPPIPIITSSPTRTARPTSTKGITATPTSTHTLVPPTRTPTITPTSMPECWQAVDITLEEVGKTLCVRGVVTELITKPNYFMVIFSHAKGAFYWVSYDMVWSQAKLRTCYQLEGTISQLGNNPILIFDYNNIPEVCP